MPVGSHFMTQHRSLHIPVLATEVLDWLNPQPGQVWVDGTLGGGGHTRLLAERVGPEGTIVALDRDPDAVAAAETELRGLPIQLVQSNFCELPEVLDTLERPTVDGVLLDLGLSSDQLADRQRGFSFEADGPLDLRFDPDQGEPAWRLLERLSADHLADLIYQLSQERFSRRIARRVVEQRREKPIRTAREFAQLVRRCVPRAKHHSIDPATRSFQALRIAVNDELGSLTHALRRFPDRVALGGRMAVISFHSLEDRLVKEAFRDDPRWAVETRKPIQAQPEELAKNPRSRSARLRVATRCDAKGVPLPARFLQTP
jgi:16S rRNA (cytosine1402-N4)-methyltransferase